MVGQQPSNRLLVDLLDRILDRTYFMVPAFALGLQPELHVCEKLDRGALCVQQMFAAEIIQSTTESCIQYVQRVVPSLLSKFQEIQKL